MKKSTVILLTSISYIAGLLIGGGYTLYKVNEALKEKYTSGEVEIHTNKGNFYLYTPYYFDSLSTTRLQADVDSTFESEDFKVLNVVTIPPKEMFNIKLLE